MEDNSENLILKILSRMQKSKENIKMQSELLEHYYQKSPPSEQKIMDTVVECICGYSLKTLINEPQNIK